MASSSTTGGSSSVSEKQRSSSSEDDVQIIMDQRKRKRMLSNRESARRSRMRKQNHVDQLRNQASQLSLENNQILTNLNITAEIYMKIEAENSVLNAQMAELSNRLESLNEIIDLVRFGSFEGSSYDHQISDNDNNHDLDYGYGYGGFVTMENDWRNPLFFNQSSIITAGEMNMF